MGYRQNACKPVGEDGVKFIEHMNEGHVGLSAWGFENLIINKEDKALDIGCGGGYNVDQLLQRCTKGHVYGVDYSETSVFMSKQFNKAAIEKGRCDIVEGNVLDLPFEDKTFDVITAFETVYYWPNLVDAFKQVNRVLKDDGYFMLCNESDGLDPEYNKLPNEIEGMVIYTRENFLDYLTQAGFNSIEVKTKENHWIKVIARKQ